MTLGTRRHRTTATLQAVAGIALACALLAAPFAANADAPEAVSQDAEHRYVGVRKCTGCHKKELIGNQIATWRQGLHRPAYDTLQHERSAQLAQELGLAGPAHEAPECLRCHVTAFALPKARFAYELKTADGIQCESCHGPGRDYRKKKIMSDPKLASSKGLWDLSRGTAICVTCHNPESPTWDPARYRLEDGTTAGFDFDQATQRIAHPIPEKTKGHYLEIEKRLKEQGLEVE